VAAIWIGRRAETEQCSSRFRLLFPAQLIENGHRIEMTPAVFLDRDGTLIEERNYLCRPEDVVVFPGVGRALGLLRAAGFKLFIVSNQSGVGRGYFTLADVERVNLHLAGELARDGATFDKIYIAPEAPDAPSRGRKPSPQFLFDARDEFGVDLTRSYMIGDKLIDLEAGWNAGVKKCVLVRTGYGVQTEHSAAEQLRRAVVVNDLNAATTFIQNDIKGVAEIHVPSKT
jgi:D-glycero-D-manno-heptose 1,7-bisphosphate phosphatase